MSKIKYLIQSHNLPTSPFPQQGTVYSNTVVVQHHSVVMTKTDKIYKVRCTYDMSSRNITFGMMPIRSVLLCSGRDGGYVPRRTLGAGLADGILLTSLNHELESNIVYFLSRFFPPKELRAISVVLWRAFPGISMS